jgi:hypothetical protein
MATIRGSDEQMNETWIRPFALLSAIVLLLICTSGLVHAQTLEWTRQLGATEQSYDVSADGLGGIYLTGYTVPAGGGPVDVFLSKYDAAGTLHWADELTAPRQDEGWSISADTLGNVFIAGETGDGGGVGRVRGVAGLTAGEFDAFVANYDASGNLLWVRQLGSSMTDVAYAVSADGVGNVYLSGFTDGSLDGSSYGNSDAFISKYDGEGNHLWVRQLGSAAADGSRGVAADSLGNVYLAVTTGGDLGGPNAGGFDAAVSKFDAAGTALWTRQFGTTVEDLAREIATDPFGNVFLAGVTMGSLGGPSAGNRDIFVSKHDAAGNLLWIRQLGTSFDEAYSHGPDGVRVSTDMFGNVYLASSTNGSLGGPNAGDSDLFFAKFDAEGNLRWTEQYGTSGAENGASVSEDGLGNIYLSGFSDLTGAFLVKYVDDVISGDFNNNGRVEQGDLDLVLLNWSSNAVPETWSNDLPNGAIDQNELDKVLLGWGNTSPVAAVVASVPEPMTAAFGLVFLMCACCFRAMQRRTLLNYVPGLRAKATSL